MTRRTNKPWLYLVKVKLRTVAIILAKDPSEAINKYIARTGFTDIHTYISNCLMTNTFEITTNAGIGISDQCYFITETIDGNFINISSQRVTSCTNIFDRVDPKDIDNPLFMRPPINEVSNCIGFGRTPKYKLRKFCI